MSPFLNELQSDGVEVTDDPRLTRVARFLRKTPLDELPQLLNVVRTSASVRQRPGAL